MGKIWMPKERKKPDQRPIREFISCCTRVGEISQFMEYARKHGGVTVLGVLPANLFNIYGQVMGEQWLVVYQARELLEMEVKC